MQCLVLNEASVQHPTCFIQDQVLPTTPEISVEVDLVLVTVRELSMRGLGWDERLSEGLDR